jgi:putative transposase
VYIPKVGEVEWIKHRPIKGKVKHITVKQDGDQWYCSVNVEIKAKIPTIKDENIVGIDFGLKTYATMSDGEVVDNPKVLNKYQRKLKRATRSLSRKAKGGCNRKKQRVRVSRIHRKIRNVRRDFQHKCTRSMIAKCDGFVLEDLNIKGMVKNHCLAKAISDVGWYEAKRQLKYKSEWFGKLYLEVGRFDPSSKCCS